MADGRSPLAVGLEWSSQIMGIAAEMLVPGVGGYWLDQRLGWSPVLTLAGFGLGMIAAGYHLFALARRASDSQRSQRAEGADRPPDSDRRK